MDLCRKEGISQAIYHNWVKDFMEGGKARLMGDSRRNITNTEVKNLRRENSAARESCLKGLVSPKAPITVGGRDI